VLKLRSFGRSIALVSVAAVVFAACSSGGSSGAPASSAPSAAPTAAGSAPAGSAPAGSAAAGKPITVGYLPKNVERLGIASLSTNIGLTGSSFGLLEGERETVTQLLGPHSNLGRPDLDVLKLLRTHRLLG